MSSAQLWLAKMYYFLINVDHFCSTLRYNPYIHRSTNLVIINKSFQIIRKTFCILGFILQLCWIIAKIFNFAMLKLVQHNGCKISCNTSIYLFHVTLVILMLKKREHVFTFNFTQAPGGCWKYPLLFLGPTFLWLPI